MKRMTKVLGVIMLAIVLLGLGCTDYGAATPQERKTPLADQAFPQGPYSGDLWNRSTLTGDWFGVRNDLAAKGVTVDMSLTQIYQGIVGGGQGRGLEVRRPWGPHIQCRYPEARIVARRISHSGSGG